MVPELAVVLQATPLQAFAGDLLWLAIVFLVLAIIAGLVGASGVAGVTMEAARWLVLLFIVLAVITFVL